MDETQDYSAVLLDIDKHLQSIDSHLTQFAGQSYQPYDDSDVLTKLGNIADKVGSGDGTSIDYTGTLQHLAQLVSYMDLMLVILICVLLLFAGIFAGSIITKWMRNR